MADLQKTISIIFGGKDDTSKTIRSIERGIDDLAGKVGSATQPLADLTKKIVATDAALAAMVVGGMAYAIKTAGEFNGKFGEISTLISDTGAPIDKFKADIKNYAVDSVKSIDDINQAIYTAVSAGVDYKKSIEFVNQAEKLSVAGRADLGDTTKVLISVLNAYGQGTDKATKYSDIMFTTVQLGLTTMTELSASLAQVTGLAANSGIPFETLSAAIAALTSTGMPTAQAISSIKAALTNILSPTDEAEKLAKKLGIQFNATALQTKGFEVVLWDAWKATGGSTEKMAQLFGSVEALNGVLVLAADKTGNFRTDLKKMGVAAKATQTGYSKVVDEFTNVNQRLENSFKITLGEIGEKLMPEYVNIAKSLSDVMKGIKIGVDSGAFDPVFAVINSFGKDLASLLANIAKNMPEALSKVDFSPLVASIKTLRSALSDAFKAIFGDIDLKTPEGLATAIEKVVKAIALLNNVTAGIIKAFGPFLSMIGKGIDKFTDADAETQKFAGKLMMVGTQISWVANNIGILTGALSILAGVTGVTNAIVLGKMIANTTTLGASIAVLGLRVTTLSQLLGGGGLAFAVGYTAGELYRRLVPGVDEATQSFAKWTDEIFNWTGTQNLASKKLEKINTALYDQNALMAVATGGVEEYYKSLMKVPGSVKTTVLVAPKLDPLATQETQWALAQAFFNKDKNKIELLTTLQTTEVMLAKAALAKAIPPKQDVTIGVQADGSSIEKAYGLILQKFPDGSMRIVQAQATLDKIALDNVKKKIDDTIPAEKQFEIKAKLDEAKIKGQAEIIQKSIEWKAKIDIAQIEASAKVIVATFASIDNTITSTGNTISNLVGSYEASQGKGGSGFIEQQVVQEGARRDKALTMQEKMTDAQVDQIKATTAAIKKGEAMIKIDGSGLQPHLEAFMFEILKAIQVKANAEGQKLLVGI